MQVQATPEPGGDGERDPHFATTLARGLEILRCFTPDAVLLGNNQLAARTRLSRPTVSRFTYTLTQLGYLRTDPDSGKYALGSSAPFSDAPAQLRFAHASVAAPLLSTTVSRSGTRQRNRTSFPSRWISVRSVSPG